MAIFDSLSALFSRGEKNLSIFAGEPAPAPTVEKFVSLVPANTGAAATVVDLGRGGKLNALLERKPSLDVMRNFAKSVWVRAAIDYYRRTAGGAKFELAPVDSTKDASRRDKQIRAVVEQLLAHPNDAEEPYTRLKEQMIEDYLVVGHGALLLDLNRDLTVRGVRPLDAALLGFIKEWDGADLGFPRYVQFDEKNPHRIKNFLAHQQVMCLVNRPVSYSRLGTSHVEILYKTVVALLSGDEFLIKQILNPTARRMIDLGEDATTKQVNEFKYDLMAVNDGTAVIGGSKNPKVLTLSGTADEMKLLDGATWFVRQVASVFGISTAKLKLSVDLSRANGETMADDDLEAVTGELTRIEELENSTFIKRYSYQGAINLQFFYPIMHRKDEKTQAIIARTQTAQPWASVNEARGRTGEKTLDQNEFPFANEPIVTTKEGPVPMTVWTKQMQELEKNIGKKAAAQIPAGGTADNTANDNTDQNAAGEAVTDGTEINSADN